VEENSYIKGTTLSSAVRVTRQDTIRSARHVCVLGVSSCSEGK